MTAALCNFPEALSKAKCLFGSYSSGYDLDKYNFLKRLQVHLHLGGWKEANENAC